MDEVPSNRFWVWSFKKKFVYFLFRLDDLYVIDMQFIADCDNPTLVYAAEVRA